MPRAEAADRPSSPVFIGKEAAAVAEPPTAASVRRRRRLAGRVPAHAVIPAAGRGDRLGGRPKALLEIGQATALERVARTLAAAGLPGLVVTGAHREAVAAEAARLGLATVDNPDWERGRTGSVQVGWRAAGEDPILLWPVDFPLVKVETAKALARRAGSACAVPLVGDRRGHPVLLGLAVRGEVLALGPDQPLHDVVRAHARLVPLDDEGALLNVNTPEDLERARRLAEARHVA